MKQYDSSHGVHVEWQTASHVYEGESVADVRGGRGGGVGGFKLYIYHYQFFAMNNIKKA